MIDRRTDPAAWATLMYELEDAQDGLRSLFQDIVEDAEFGEEAFRVHMAHIYSHLNRAWNGRNTAENQLDDDAFWGEWKQFPTDLKPL